MPLVAEYEGGETLLFCSIRTVAIGNLWSRTDEKAIYHALPKPLLGEGTVERVMKLHLPAKNGNYMHLDTVFHDFWMKTSRLTLSRCTESRLSQTSRTGV